MNYPVVASFFSELTRDLGTGPTLIGFGVIALLVYSVFKGGSNNNNGNGYNGGNRYNNRNNGNMQNNNQYRNGMTVDQMNQQIRQGDMNRRNQNNNHNNGGMY